MLRIAVPAEIILEWPIGRLAVVEVGFTAKELRSPAQGDTPNARLDLPTVVRASGSRFLEPIAFVSSCSMRQGPLRYDKVQSRFMIGDDRNLLSRANGIAIRDARRGRGPVSIQEVLAPARRACRERVPRMATA